MNKVLLVMLCLAPGLIVPALAQDAGGEGQQPAATQIDSAATLKLFVDACTDLSGGDSAAYDRANASGWVPNDTGDTGPYNAVYSGSREVAGLGEIDIWASVQSFPTQRLGYCRIDFSDPDNLLDLGAMNGIGGLTGTVQPRDGGDVFGSWEGADKKLLVIGDRTEGAVEIEFNFLLGAKPAS